MSRRVITFVPDHGRKPPKETPGEAPMIVLPVIRIERRLVEPYPNEVVLIGTEPFITSPIRKRREARAALKGLEAAAMAVGYALKRLREIAGDGHDARALGELIEHAGDEWDALRTQAEADGVLELVEQVLDVYRMKLAKERP